MCVTLAASLSRTSEGPPFCQRLAQGGPANFRALCFFLWFRLCRVHVLGFLRGPGCGFWILGALELRVVESRVSSAKPCALNTQPQALPHDTSRSMAHMALHPQQHRRLHLKPQTPTPETLNPLRA